MERNAYGPRAGIVIVDQKGVVAGVLHPKDLNEKVIDTVLAGRAPVLPPLPPEAYWNPETAAQCFLQVGKEDPPAK